MRALTHGRERFVPHAVFLGFELLRDRGQPMARNRAENVYIERGEMIGIRITRQRGLELPEIDFRQPSIERSRLGLLHHRAAIVTAAAGAECQGDNYGPEYANNK